ncbi:MAG: lipid-A-disaccharide synthase [Deltaproteobacteria bacterium]|nr:lipid-A-disaccharide synthase [Deltaproteobacteria bacterium]
MASIFISAGEASGDIHAGKLVRALRELRPSLGVRAVGGESLRGAGAEVVFPMEELAAMGLWEAAGRIPALLRARRTVLSDLECHRPDVFVPVDFGGLNLRLAGAARAAGIPVVYYIPPKVWAWGSWRAKRLREAVEEALVILPFEEELLGARGVRATYVGSPVLDHIGPRSFDPEADTVGLLPGSRAGEVSRIWPLLLEAARLLAARRPLRFLVPRAPGLPAELFALDPGSGLSLEVVTGRAQEVMERSALCLVASGTATLECAVVGTPMVVVYRVSALTYFLGKRLLSVPFVSLPNLIAGRRIVPELVQTSAEAVAGAAEPLLEGGPEREEMLAALAGVRELLGGPGASVRAARRLLTLLEDVTWSSSRA